MSPLEEILDPVAGQATSTANWLVYDGECPFCSRYVALLKIREAVGPLKLVDARAGGLEADEVVRAGLDLDEGMVLKLSGRLYHGDDAVHALAMLSEPTGVFNRFNGWVFRSRRRSALLYPIMRAGRNATLRFLGRRKLKAGNL